MSDKYMPNVNQVYGLLTQFSYIVDLLSVTVTQQNLIKSALYLFL